MRQRLLRAIINLQYFSAQDLAGHAGTSDREAADLLDDSTEYVEALTPPLEVKGPGGGMRTHRLREDRIAALAAQLGGTSPSHHGDEVMHEAPSLLSLAETTVGDLAVGGVPAARFDIELNLAERQWLGAKASLRDRLATNDKIESGESGRLAAMRVTLDRLRQNGRAPLPLPEDSESLRATVRHRLVDWTAPAPASAASEGVRRLLARHTPAALFRSLLAAEPPRSVFWPAAALEVLWPEMTADYRAAAAKQLADELCALNPGRDLRRLVTLAIAAALVDADDAAEPLFIAVLRAVGLSGFRPEPLDLCCAALARLARPAAVGSPRHLKAAVLGCHYLSNLDHGITDESRARLRIPLIAAPEIAVPPPAESIWQGLRTLWGAGDGAALRNYATSLCKLKFSPLPEHLMAYPGNSRLLTALGDAKTSAIAFMYAGRYDQSQPGMQFQPGMPYAVSGRASVQQALRLDGMTIEPTLLPPWCVERVGSEIEAFVEEEWSNKWHRSNVFACLSQQAASDIGTI